MLPENNLSYLHIGLFLLQKAKIKYMIVCEIFFRLGCLEGFVKKQIKLIDLDCTICAGKLQDAVSKIEGVNSCQVSFFTQKMVLDYDETKYDDVRKEIIRVKKKILPDVQIIGL